MCSLLAVLAAGPAPLTHAVSAGGVPFGSAVDQDSAAALHSYRQLAERASFSQSIPASVQAV